MLDAAFRYLDARAVLGLRVWGFSWHSLRQPYGRLVLRQVAARHPLRTLAGLRAYRRWVRSGRGAGAISQLGSELAADTCSSARAQSAGRLLVGVGFCQKPLHCPAGRFNSHCLALDLPRRPLSPFAPCAACAVLALADRVVAAGAALYIMTSAQQIAHDLFLPTLAGTGFSRVALALCPLSVQPMALMLHICRIQGLLLAYGAGACDTYARWLAADRGDKPERTVLTPEAALALDEILAGAAGGKTERASRVRREGNVYLPTS
jgi:hypothetical protein